MTKTLTIVDFERLFYKSALNTAQAKILGYKKFNAVPRGWKNKDYTVSEKDYYLFIALTGIRGKSNQAHVINDFDINFKSKEAPYAIHIKHLTKNQADLIIKSIDPHGLDYEIIRN